MSSEIYSYIYEKALDKGALDIYTQSIYMKKNRAAIKISILCKEEDLEKFKELLLLETSTFGVRYNTYNRSILDRKIEKVDTNYGVIKVKLGYYKGELIKAIPEYEDCKLIANRQQVPLIKVFAEINRIIMQKFGLNLLT